MKFQKHVQSQRVRIIVQKNLDQERTIEETDNDYNAIICNNNEEEPVVREPVSGSTLGNINNDVNDNYIYIKIFF